jgi:hypothetical protein
MDNKLIKIFEEIINNKNNYINNFKENIKDIKNEDEIKKNNNFIDFYNNLKLEEIKKYDINLLNSNVLHSNDIFKIIEYNNIKVIHLLKNKFKDNNIINIVAKGPSAKNINNGLGINQGIIFTNKEFLFLNDIQSLFGIENLIKDIKYIFFPDYPHYCSYDNSFNIIGGKPLKNMNFRILINYLKYFNFSGEIFIYKIQTSFDKTNLNNYSFRSMTTTDIPINIFSKFLFKKNFNTYGYNNGRGYHSNFKNLNFLNMDNFDYIHKIRLFNEIPLFIKVYLFIRYMYKNKYNYNLIDNKENKKVNEKKLDYIFYNHNILIY